jgi:hypothetical protein
MTTDKLYPLSEGSQFRVDTAALMDEPRYLTATEVRHRWAEVYAREIDRTARWLLGQWVSELEPCLVMRNGQILGLAWVGDPGNIVVYNGIDPRLLLDAAVGIMTRKSLLPMAD